MSDQQLTPAAPDVPDPIPAQQKPFKEEAEALLEQLRADKYNVQILFSSTHEKLALISEDDEKAMMKRIEGAQSLSVSAQAEEDKALAHSLFLEASKLKFIVAANKFMHGQKDLDSTLQVRSTLGWTWPGGFISCVHACVRCVCV